MGLGDTSDRGQAYLLGFTPPRWLCSERYHQLQLQPRSAKRHRYHDRFPKQTRDRYGTRRHAAAMVGLWRKQFPEEEATVVWEACAESGVLEEMGYVK